MDENFRRILLADALMSLGKTPDDVDPSLYRSMFGASPHSLGNLNGSNMPARALPQMAGWQAAPRPVQGDEPANAPADSPPLSLNGGGIYQDVTGGKVLGYGGRGEVAMPIGDGAQLRLSLEGQGQVAGGRGWRNQQNRIEGAGATLALPGGDEWALQWQDKQMPVRDTLPGALPVDLGIPVPPSRGWRLNYRQPF